MAHADLNKLKWSARSDDPAKIISQSRTDVGLPDSVDISLADPDLEILPSGDESCAISWETASVNGESPVDYEVKDGVLTVTEIDPAGDSYIHVDISFLADLLCGKNVKHPADTVYLYVPDETFNQITIRNAMGDISIDGLQAEHGSLLLDDGDAICTNCQLSDFSLSNTLGKLTITDTALDTCDITFLE